MLSQNIAESSKSATPSQKIHKPATISGLDDYIYRDFVIESRQIFPSIEALDEWFIKNYPRIAADILFGSGYILKKDTTTDLHSRIQKISLFFTYTFQKISKGRSTDAEDEVGMDQMMKRCQDVIPTFSKETFKPMGHKLIRGEYNTWSSFKAQTSKTEEEEAIDMTVVQPILDFIREVIADENEISNTYIMSWLSHIICKPWRKTEVALFLHSDEKGTGKSTLGHWLKNYVFGSHISNVISGLSKLTQKHNTVIQKKIFTLVEEIPAVSGEFHSQFDIMKHLITDPECMIEPKGIDPFPVPNFVNFMLISNNLMALKLERGDRRYCCFEVSAKRKADEQYWDNIHSEVLTEDSAKEFYKYLKYMPDSDKVSLRKIPKTDLRQTMIQNSIPTHQQFFIDIKDSECEYSLPDNAFIKEFAYKGDTISDGLRADTLYQLYTNYCSSRGEKVLRQRLFFNSVVKYISKTKAKIDKKSAIVYRIN